jgi:5'-nucleotidase
MEILATNDDGVNSEGLRSLVSELSKIARVTVVAPAREQSAIGTAVTLRQALKVQKLEPLVPEVETYSVEGTPSDSVILAQGKLVKGRVDLVVSGINKGSKLGEDVHISGTVGAALQAYLRGFPALAISAAYENHPHLDAAAKVAAVLAQKITNGSALKDIFLNVNLPDLPLAGIKGIEITRLASESHINTVEESDGTDNYYKLVRQRTARAINSGTDIWALEQGRISITPLYTRRFDKSSLPQLNRFCADLTRELKLGG